jgi:fructuronate reductase
MTDSPLLSLATLNGLPEPSRPLLAPGSAGTGIVHLGLGAFFRAHQAVFTEEAIVAGGGDWGIVGVAPRSAAVVTALDAQDRLFSVTTLSGAGSSTRVIGVLSGTRRASADPAGVVALLADPAVRIVTLTVSEKGYRIDPATGALRADDELRADLTTGRDPGTIPGLLVRGLLARCRADAGPIALMSCDNLPSNGRLLRALVELALRRVSPAVGPRVLDWVAQNVTFPGTMVDRIVPATTAQTLATAAGALGVRDLAAVCGEPYMQWVIEDDFRGGRPAWERAGAVLTDDAGPWERLKLRTLNGVHSAIAYLGAVAGRETIAEAMEIPGLQFAMRRFIAEDVAHSLVPPEGVSVVEYGEEVLVRFANPGIEYRSVQVATDGSQKLPQRVLPTILDRRKAGASPRWGALVMAAWIRYAQGLSDDGRELPLNDPLAGEIRTRLAAAPSTPEGSARALLSLEAVVPAGLLGDEVLCALVVEWLTDFDKHGVEATLAGLE